MSRLNLHFNSSETYIELARDLMNLGPLSFQITEQETIAPSLRSVRVLKDGSQISTHEVSVEVISTPSFNLNGVKKTLNKIKAYQDIIPYNVVYVILFHPVSKLIQTALEDGLISIVNIDFKILDSIWIEKTLEDNPELIKKYQIKEGGESKTMTFDPDQIVKFTSFLEVAQNRQVFLSHHIWGSKDQLKFFLSNNEWRPQNAKRNEDLLEKISRGDIVILNSTQLVGDGLQMKVVAIGVFKSFAINQGAMEVEWKELNSTIIIPDSDAFTNAFSLLSEINSELILTRLYGADSDLLKILDELTEIVPIQSSSGQNIEESNSVSISNLIQSHLNENKNFWWLHARVEKWEINELEIGQSEPYRATDSSGKIQRNFHEIEVGDLVIGYQGAPEKKVKGIFQVDEKDLNSHVSFKLLYKIKKQPSLNDLRKLPNFEKSTINKVRVGSIHPLTPEILEEVISSTELANPTPNPINNPDNPRVESTKDKIPFHNDVVAQEDKLGREPVAKAFVDLLKKDIFTDEMNHAFMVHLQGEWGAGKSTFLNLIKKHLSDDKEDWIVVNYNAWQNQHITPPWWTLIDQIYRQTKTHKAFKFFGKLRRSENLRRLKLYTGWQLIIAIILTLIFTTILITKGNSIVDYITHLPFFEGDNEVKETGSAIGAFSKLFLTLASVVTIIFTFSKLVSSSFFLNSSDDANSFIKRSADPMSRIKVHFGKLVDNINTLEKQRKLRLLWSTVQIPTSKIKKRQLAIFIDDIDRCNRDFIIELLEGIQTLFKDKKVLYIVAGDKNWITTSFANAYSEFNNQQSSKQHNLGELFLEKAFQLSLRMPNISDASKEEYWSHILGITEATNQKKVEVEEISSELKKEVQQELDTAVEDITTPEFIQKFEEKHNLSSNAASSLIIEKKNESDQEIRHLLKDLHGLVETNPRSIIRLANNYTMTRSTLIAERKNFDAEKLLRWLILKDLNPSVIDAARSNKELEEIKEEIKDPLEKEPFEKLLALSKNGKVERLTVEEIKQFEGI